MNKDLETDDVDFLIENKKKMQTEAPLLVVQTAFLGDLLLSIPLLRRLRQLRPRSPIYLVARHGLGRLLEELGLVDQVFEVKKGNRESYRRVREELKSVNFEWILCPHGSLTSALFCSKLRAAKKISFSSWWNFLYFNERITKDLRLPEALRQLSLLKFTDPIVSREINQSMTVDLRQADARGRMNAVPDWASLNLHFRLKARTPAIRVDNRAIVFFPGSVWATKRWTEAGFLKVATTLAQEGFQIYWMGSREEKAICDRLSLALAGSQNLAGQFSLFEGMVILSHARLVISNDSGGQHLAAVAGTPTVTVFGPTVLAQGFRPWNSKALVAELKEVSCRPCGAHGHQKCPIGTHECMQKLPPSLVLDRVLELLQIDKSL